MLNSRFWFDMYQRLKDEMSIERRSFLEQQSQQAMNSEHEACMYRQRLSSLLSDKDQLQRDNEDLSSEIGQWRKKCLHIEKSFEVRDFEGRQAIEFVITELTQVDRQLKGDHSILQHVIAKLNDLMTSQQLQHHNGGAGLGSGNPVVLVLYELLEIFKVMIRQLKLTQKEMKRYRQQ